MANDPPSHLSPSAPSGQSPKDYLRLLWARKWVVLLVALVVAGGVEGLTLRQHDVFRAEARLTIPPPAPVFVNGIAQQQQKTTEFNQEQAEIVGSPVIASRVIGALGLTQNPHALAARIKADVLPNTDILRVGFASGSATKAAELANAVADQYLAYRHETDIAGLEAARKGLENRIAQDAARLAQLRKKDQSDRSVAVEESAVLADQNLTRTRIQDLDGVEDTVRNAGEVLDRAQVPRKPFSPDRFRSGVLGVVLGLILGAAGAFILEYFRDNLSSPEEVERLVGAPVLALVPDTRQGRRDEALLLDEEIPGPLTEAFRTLRTNLQFIAHRDGLKTLVVTSPSLADGKTVTASNIAVALTQVGKRVVLIDADLRRPRIAKLFGLDKGQGLSSVLVGEVSMQDVVARPDVPNLRLIPSGPIPAQPTELLGGEEMPKIIAACQEAADFVIIDSPPVVGLADPSVLATYADGVLLVISQGAGRRLLRQARAQLERVNARVVGVVANKVQSGRRGYYYYDTYYPYYRYTYSENGEKRRGSRRRSRARSRA